MGHFQWVKGFVKRIAARWKGAPPLEVVPTHYELPVRADIGVRGMYVGGRAFVVASQLPATVAQTVTHEVLGHYSVRALLRGRWLRFMNGLHRGMHSGDRPLRQLRDKVRKLYVDGRGRCRLHPHQVADEAAAYAVEASTDPWTGDYTPPRSGKRRRFQDVMAALRKPQAAKLRFGYADLCAVLRVAAAKLKSGCAHFGHRMRPRPGPSGVKRSWRSRAS